MQEDMHFWGTYVISRAAGIPMEDAHTIAYAAQYVDDSTKQDSEPHEDGGLLYGIATAHHPKDSVINSVTDRTEQRRVWVPFHFIPGGEGEALEEKLLCTKDSDIAREMISHHIEVAKQKKHFGMELIGIAAHTYMDTFSHYGFSGISSHYNAVDSDSFEFVNIVEGSKIEKYLYEKSARFAEKFSSEKPDNFIRGLVSLAQGVISSAAETASGSLGHAGVNTYPDRPFLHWKVSFEHERSDGSKESDRNNPETYLEGCEKLHKYLSKFADDFYEEPKIQKFEDIRGDIDEIINVKGNKDERIDKWKNAINGSSIYPTDQDEPEKINYDSEIWEQQKKQFHDLDSSIQGIDTHAYRFHQAAALHRYYVLKDLLPRHKIAVY